MTRHCFFGRLHCRRLRRCWFLLSMLCLNSFQFRTVTELNLRCLSWWWLSLLVPIFFSTIHSVLLPLIYQISVTNSHTHTYIIEHFITNQGEKKKVTHPSKCCATRCDFISSSLCWHILMFMSHFWIHIGWRFCQNMFSFQFFKNYWFWLWYNKFFLVFSGIFHIQFKNTPHTTHLVWTDVI